MDSNSHSVDARFAVYGTLSRRGINQTKLYHTSWSALLSQTGPAVMRRICRFFLALISNASTTVQDVQAELVRILDRLVNTSLETISLDLILFWRASNRSGPTAACKITNSTVRYTMSLSVGFF